MSVTLPTDYQTIDFGEISIGDDIDSEEIQKIVQNNHWLYARAGSRASGMVWKYDSTPNDFQSAVPFETAGDGDNQNPGPDLEVFRPTIYLRRPKANGNYDVDLAIYGGGIDVEIQYRLLQPSGNVPMSQGVFALNGTKAAPEWTTLTFEHTGQGPYEYLIQIDSYDTNDGGVLYQTSLRESILSSASDIP